MHDGSLGAVDDPLISQFRAAQGRRVMKAVIDLEAYFAPLEMVAFAQALAASDHPDRQIILQRSSFVTLLADTVKQPFQRRAISPEISFYSDGGPAAGKVLLICFGGMGGRLGLPIAAFLQALDARRTDVVMLRDPLQRSYRLGAGDYAADFAGLMAALRQQFPADRYARLVTFGNSMGAAPALRAGFLLDAERAIGIGTRLASDALMLILRRQAGVGFDPFCDCLRAQPYRGVLVYSEGCAVDVEAALQMERIGAGRRVVFRRMSEHNLMERFWSIGELRAFMRLLIDGPLPVDRAVDRASPAPPVFIGRSWLPRLRAGVKARIKRLVSRKRR